jgi:hypothetical protein
VGHHVVQCYGHDEELAERVAGYLPETLEGGRADSVTRYGHLDASAEVCRLH